MEKAGAEKGEEHLWNEDGQRGGEPSRGADEAGSKGGWQSWNG